jgi:peroxiredoxin 2/4
MIQRQVGLPAPSFTLESVSYDDNIKEHSLEDYRGRWLILFFYPMDFTFVCPTEITALSDRHEELQSLDCDVLGVSTDSVYTHRAWLHTPQSDGGLGAIAFPLGADTTHEVSRAYGVLEEEQGVAQRGLFIIDPDGLIRFQMTTDGDVGRNTEEVLHVLQALQSGGPCAANGKPNKK